MATAGRFEHPLMDQAMVYHRMQGELERDYFGQWVIIHDSKLVGGYGSYDDAEESAQQMGLDVLVLSQPPNNNYPNRLAEGRSKAIGPTLRFRTLPIPRLTEY